MQKEFDLKTFKKSASNVSGFLKDKNVDISHVTLYNALSLFLGYKNWNTLNNVLSKPAGQETTKNKKVDDSSIDLIFKNRVIRFVDFFKNVYNAEYGSHIVLVGKATSPYRMKVENIFEAAEKLINSDNDDLDLSNIGAGKYENKFNFECNDSMSDEKCFSIKIAQKGAVLFPYLDVLLYVFAAKNKWFESYIMGYCNYSYVYDESYQKQVIELNLPIDNFMVVDFNDQLIKLEMFLNHFSSSAIRIDIERSDMGSGIGMFTQTILNRGGFSGSASGSGGSLKSQLKVQDFNDK